MTVYRIDGRDHRIGQRSGWMDCLLLRGGTKQAALISAWNPRSRRMPPGWNRRMQAGLAARFRRFWTVPAEGMWRRWKEAHVLVPLPRARAAVIARCYRQNAIVVFRAGQKAKLAWVR